MTRRIYATKEVKIILVILVYFLSGIFFISLQRQVTAARSITFPVIGGSSYSNDYNAPRDGGERTHHAIDIIANKRQLLVAAVSGTIVDVQYPEPDWGYSVTIQDSDGYRYRYIHMNDDNPGTNDGKGGGMNAYAVDVKEGNRVIKGQLIGRVGDSGNSNGVSHLHFEMFRPNGDVANPYLDLNRAKHISQPASYPALPNELLPFNTWYDYKLNIARDNLTGSSADEIIVGTGHGQKPKIRVFNSSKQQIDGFYPSNTSATYGVDVAVGDVDGDDVNEIIAGYRTVSGPKIAIFKKTQDTPLNFTKVKEFTAFEGNTSPRVAAGDVDGDGKDEIIAVKGRGSSPAVRTFDENGETLKTSFVLPRDFRDGLDVASGDVADTTNDEIVVSVLTEGSSFIRVFDADFNKVAGKGFYAYKSSYRGGVYVSVGNVITGTAKAEILTLPNGAHPSIKYFNATGDNLQSTYFIEQWWEGYYDIAAGNGGYFAATGGNRRGSIR